MKLGMPWALGWLGAVVASFPFAGCLGDLKVTGPGDGGGGSGATGGAGGESGAGGNMLLCAPSTIVDCNTGQTGTCAAGKATCSADGMSLGTCLPASLSFDDCTTAADEDCDGMAISQCTGKMEWTMTRAGAPQAPNDDSIFDVAVIPTGGYAITGVVNGSIDTGLTVNAGTLYIAKLDDSGAKQWERTFPALPLAAGRAIDVDSAGNIVVVGEFNGSLLIDGTSLKSEANSKDIFIGKFDNAGNAMWVKSFGSTEADIASAVAIDSTDNIIFTGRVRAGDVDFGGGVINASADDLFVAKFTANGTYLWSKIFLNPMDQQGRGVAVLKNDDLVVIGDSNANFSLGGNTHMVNAGYDCFIARFAGADGAFLWSRSMAGNGDQTLRALALTPDDKPIIAGKFSNFIDFGGGNSMMAAGSVDAFLAEFDVASGAYVRSIRFGSQSAYGIGLATDGAGHVYATGAYSGKITLGSTTLMSGSSFDVYAMKLDATSWLPLWMRSYGMAGNQYGLAVTVDHQGRAIVAGSFEAELAGDVASDMLQSTGNFDMFTRRLAP